MCEMCTTGDELNAIGKFQREDNDDENSVPKKKKRIQLLDAIIHIIVSAKNMRFFVRQGGFHQLVSFLGSIGTLMEGSDLKSALETVYATVAVRHMFTGKSLFACSEQTLAQRLSHSISFSSIFLDCFES